MRTGVPAYVLLARLERELKGARLAFDAEQYDRAGQGLRNCTSLVNELMEAV